MAIAMVVYWRDIPAQVIVKQGRTTAKRELDTRFQEAIDMAAMRSGAIGTDAYLNDWRRGPGIDCDNDLEAEADRHQAEIEQAFDATRIAALVKNGGYEKDAN